MSSFANNNAPRTQSRMTGRVRESGRPVRSIPDFEEYSEYVTRDGRRIFIPHALLRELVWFERSHNPDETAALLFGRFFSDGSHDCTVVSEMILPEPGEVHGTPSTVTITAEGAHQMTIRARRRNPCADAVGWAHTHPRFEAFFSGTDRMEQRAWKEPTSVGLVVSGLSNPTHRYCVFVGPDSSPAEAVEPQSPAPLRWTGFIGHQSEPAPHPALVEPDMTGADPPANPGPVNRRRRRRRTPVVAIAYVLALAAIALSLLAWRTASAAQNDARHATDAAQTSTQLAARAWWESGAGPDEIRTEAERAHALALQLAQLLHGLRTYARAYPNGGAPESPNASDHRLQMTQPPTSQKGAQP